MKSTCLSCPAVSQSWRTVRSPSTNSVFIWKSTPETETPQVILQVLAKDKVQNKMHLAFKEQALNKSIHLWRYGCTICSLADYGIEQAQFIFPKWLNSVLYVSCKTVRTCLGYAGWQFLLQFHSTIYKDSHHPLISVFIWVKIKDYFTTRVHTQTHIMSVYMNEYVRFLNLWICVYNPERKEVKLEVVIVLLSMEVRVIPRVALVLPWNSFLQSLMRKLDFPTAASPASTIL